MANEIKPIYDEKYLLSYIRKIRLEKAVTLTANNVEKNSSKENEPVKNFFKKTIKNVMHYDNKSNEAQEEYARFKSNYVEPTFEAANIAKKEVFSGDNTGISKLLFSIEILMDHEYKYQYEKEGIEEASEFLYGDRTTLHSIKSDLETYYKQINAGDLSSSQSKIMYGVAATGLAVSLLIPLVSAPALFTTAAGITAIGMNAVVTTAAFMGTAYLVMDAQNRAIVKKAYKNMSASDQNMYLAIQVMIIKKLRTTLNEEQFKEELDKRLRSLNMLKGDLDYFYFVEGDNKKENSMKLNGFHGFDKVLGKVL